MWRILIGCLLGTTPVLAQYASYPDDSLYEQQRLKYMASLGEQSPAATAQLIGQVRDHHGLPLAGVQIQAGNATTRTDATGSFSLEGLPAIALKVALTRPNYAPEIPQIWLVAGLTSRLDAVLSPAVSYRPQTRLGLVGVGSLPKTDQLAQRLAEELVRLKGFPLVEPLAYFERSELLPIVQVLTTPLAEILARDRQDPALVAEFFRYLGVKALVVARSDALIRPDSFSLNTRLIAVSRLELWRFRGETLQIQVLREERSEEQADPKLSPAEADTLLMVQTTKMARRTSSQWEQPNNPWQEFIGDTQAEPTGQTTSTKVEFVPVP